MKKSQKGNGNMGRELPSTLEDLRVEYPGRGGGYRKRCPKNAKGEKNSQSESMRGKTHNASLKGFRD